MHQSWQGWFSHAANLGFAFVLIQGRGTQMTPPLEQHRVANQLEPRCEGEVGLLEHGLQVLCRNVFGVPHLVRVGVQIDIRLNEQDIVNWTALC